jgi:elongation factor G
LLAFQPIARGQGVLFEHSRAEKDLPSMLVAATERGFRRALEREDQLGGPVVDIRCTLINGFYHEEDSHESDFEEVGFKTTVEALQKAGTRPVDDSTR